MTPGIESMFKVLLLIFISFHFHQVLSSSSPSSVNSRRSSASEISVMSTISITDAMEKVCVMRSSTNACNSLKAHWDSEHDLDDDNPLLQEEKTTGHAEMEVTQYESKFYSSKKRKVIQSSSSIQAPEEIKVKEEEISYTVHHPKSHKRVRDNHVKKAGIESAYDNPSVLNQSSNQPRMLKVKSKKTFSNER